MVILEKIRELRKKKGYSQKYMADLLHLSNSGYANIEKGENVLSVERFLEICRILDVKSYNIILPAINTEYTTEIEHAVISGGLTFEQINRTALYIRRSIDDLIERMKTAKHINIEKTLADLDFITDHLDLISKDSKKQGTNLLSIKNMIDNID
jgi:transcriptional regulator with XRE-family HTH domain